MAMLQTTLADELKALALYDTEVAAAAAWAQAFANYFQGVTPPVDSATSNALPIAPGAIPAAQAAMQGGLTGMNTPGAAAATIAAAILVFWSALVPATAWPGSTGIILPTTLTLPALTATLQGVFTANISGELSKDDSMVAIAGAIHPLNAPPAPAAQGQTVWPGPLQFPIT